MTVERSHVDMAIDGVTLRIAYEIRRGRGAPVLLLHGFGSTKEDYSDLALYPGLADRTLIAFDAPGCGESECSDLSAVSMPLLQRVTAWLVAYFDLRHYHLVGHSMGGLAALLHAYEYPEGILSIVSIEGNLAPDDCFLSRQVHEHPDSRPERFIASLADRVRQWPGFSNALYAIELPHRVRAAAVPSLFESIVELSDSRRLLKQFLSLRCPRMFVYGSLNSSLSYLEELRCDDVRVVEIPCSGHFPMYANPPALWSALSRFIDDAESEIPGIRRPTTEPRSGGTLRHPGEK